MPVKAFPDRSGWVKVIVGAFEELSSAIPNYSEQFLYHIHLEPGANFAISFADKIDSIVITKPFGRVALRV